MQKSMELLHRRVTPAVVPGEVAESREGRFTRAALASFFLGPLFITALGLVSIIALGWLGLERSGGLNLEYLYLLIIVLVSWKAGTLAGLACTLASASLLLATDLAVNGSRASGLLFCVNSVMRLAAFAGIGWVAGIAGGRTRGLATLVEERTAGLRLEIAEHKETAELFQEAIQLLTQVTENIADVFWVTDPLKTEVEYVSPGFERVW